MGVFLPFLLFRPEPLLHLLAGVLYTLAAITDYIDGYMARSFSMESKLGKILDPTMDKVLNLTPMASFAVFGVYSPWWLVPIFFREMVVTFCRIGWLLEGKAIGAEKMGKLKFVFQVGLLLFAFLYFLSFDFQFLVSLRGGFKIMTMIGLVLTLVLTLFSGFSFVRHQRQNFLSPAFAHYTAACGVGLLPGPAGTWGSVLGLMLYFLVAWNVWLCLATFAFVFAAGYWAVLRMDLSSNKDPLDVVVDEVLGMFVTLFAIPPSWQSALVGFLLFRLFDVIKPFPCKRLEKLPGYWGIVADDLGAGLYSWVVLFFLFLR